MASDQQVRPQPAARRKHGPDRSRRRHPRRPTPEGPRRAPPGTEAERVKPFIVSPLAADDLNLIWLYLAEEASEEFADRTLEKLIHSFAELDRKSTRLNSSHRCISY